MGAAPFTRDAAAYVEGLKLMSATCSNLVVFVPPGHLAQELRQTVRPDLVVYDYISSVWDLPHLSGRRKEFYGCQVRLCREGGSRKPAYGEPHSWGAWNTKAFLVLEAIRLNPFNASHFIWLDARLPLC